MPKISVAAYSVLKAATCSGTKIILNSGDLERSLYEEVAQVLERLGGKWKGGKTRAHLFDYDVTPDWEDILATGEMPPNNPLDFYPTSEEIAKKMVGGLSKPNPLWIADPSAGEGVLLREAKLRYPNAHFHAIELEERRARRLKTQGWTTFNEDFLLLKPGRDIWFYDIILMNPPFNVEGNPFTYIDHITHAFACLPPTGELSAIACRNFKFRTEAKVKQFCALIERYGQEIDLPEDAFEHCNIKTPTSLVRLIKPA